MNTVNLDNLILIERNKLWADKKKLYSHVVLNAANEQADVKCRRISIDLGSVNCGNYPRAGKDKGISFITTNAEPRMRAMVRQGEYSPLNPNFLSPGKFMLGLGEYEERRRLFMLQKKHEYKEYLSQARLLAHSRNENPACVRVDSSESKYKLIQPFNENKRLVVSVNNKGVQVPEDLPYIKNGQYLPDISVATAPNCYTRGLETPTRPISSVNWIEEVPSQDHSQHSTGSNYVFNHLKLSLPDSNSAPNQSDHPAVDSNNSKPSENLSPRERKMADLQVSEQLSKILLESASMQEETPSKTPDFLERKQNHSAVYKEELRKQIEEKRKLEVELKEKEKREEEAINRRVEEQQKRLRFEYLKEETKKQNQRTNGCQEYPEKQQVNTSNEVHLVELEQDSINNIKHRPVLPETNCSHSNSCGVQSSQQPDNQKSNVLKTATSDSKYKTKNHVRSQKRNSLQFTTNQSFKSPSFTILDSTISNDINIESQDDIARQLTESDDHIISCKTCNFNDSLPIPLVRPMSQVNVPVKTVQNESSRNRTSGSSQAMAKLEAKWQVPAVEKNSIVRTTHKLPGGKSQQKNVLTQLGTFRRQLQLEQLKLLEDVTRVNSQGITK